MTVDDKVYHDQNIRKAHVRAINQLKEQMKKAEGYERELLEKSEAYHMACLHRQWFSLSRRENERHMSQAVMR